MSEFSIPKDVVCQPISWLNQNAEIMDYLERNGFRTVKDVIARQNEIPQKYAISLKAKIIFGIDNYS